MSDSSEIAATSRDALNAEVVKQFRASGGVVGGSLADTPLLLLHHVGARSGLTRVTPLVVSLRMRDKFVVIASNSGAVSHPSWYFNLKANPIAIVEFGSEEFRVRAEELHGGARDEIWKRILAHTSSPTAFQAATDRLIPVLVLTRTRNSEEPGMRSANV